MKRKNLLILMLATSLMISVSFFPMLSATSISINEISNNNTTICSISNPWDDTEVLSPDTYLTCEDHSIAIGPDDTIHVVWADENGLYYKTKNKFGDWSHAERFKIFSDGYCDGTAIDVDLSGALHLVYVVAPSDGTENIYYMKKPKYGSWSKGKLISEGSEADSREPAISTGPDESVHIVWIEDVLGRTSIRYREKVSGSWNDVEIIQERAQTVERPAIDVDNSGNVHLAWTMGDPDSGWYGNLYYIKKSANGDWGEKEKVSGISDVGSPYSINIEADSRDNIHMVWETAPKSANYDEHHIVYCKRSSAGWGNIQYVISDDNVDDTYQPSLSVDRNGNVHIVCKDSYGVFNSDIIYIKKQHNGGWSDIELVSCYKDLPGYVHESYVSYPYVVSDSGGGIHIIWKDNTQYNEGAESGEAKYDIFYRYRAPGTIHSSAPLTPSIEGPTSGTTDVDYDYEIQAEDPDDDQIYYTISWGDGSADEWFGPYESGEKITVTHNFYLEDSYLVRCKVRDEKGLESDWGVLHVSIPKNKHSFIRYTNFISKKFPLIERLLQIPLFEQLIKSQNIL